MFDMYHSLSMFFFNEGVFFSQNIIGGIENYLLEDLTE